MRKTESAPFPFYAGLPCARATFSRLIPVNEDMHGPNANGLSLYFTREYLRAGVLVSLLSVWVLVGLFYYLNRYPKRRYFTIWTVAWLFYALWITLAFGTQGE